MRLTLLFVGIAMLAANAGARPFFTDVNGKELSSERTICGSDDMVKMVDQNDKMQKMGEPIGIYKLTEGGGSAYCTGTMISKDLFITARHCAGSCKRTTVTFGYLQRDRQESFRCKEIVEQGDESNANDYLIIRLEGSPGAKWGWYDMAAKDLAKGDQLMMIHHPNATPMKISLKGCEYMGDNSGLMNHRCDTQGGSSGSAIFSPDLDHPENTRIVGIHTLGGCDETPNSTNSGPSIKHLSEISPLIKSMLRN